MNYNMRKSFFFAVVLLSQMVLAAPKIQQVEPLNWWTDMKMPLTLMFHGEDLQDAQVTVQQIVKGKVVRGACVGLVPTGQHNAESANYLFVDMAVNQPGTYRITLKKGKKSASVDYTLYDLP